MKRIGAILLGMVTTVALLVLFILVSNYFISIPEISMLKDEKEIWKCTPVLLLLCKLISALIGSFIGAIVTTKIDKDNSGKNTTILAGFFTLLAILNFIGIGNPVWFWILMIVIFFPSIKLGRKIFLSFFPS